MDQMKAIEKELSDEIAKFSSLQKEYQKTVTLRQQLDGQLNENKLVKEELDLLQDKDTVYKLIGPVLTKQDLKDAKENVGRRIEYINDEIKRHDGSILDFEKKQDAQKDVITALQQKLQQIPKTA